MFDHERDLELAKRLVEGDPLAFEALYASYARPLKTYFYRSCFDQAEAEDLVHETFLRLWRARERYQPMGKFSTYLFQIAKNLWLNRRERILRNPVKQALATDERSEAEAVADPRTISHSAGDELEREELLAALREAIDDLPEIHRDVVILGKLEGMRYRDIAEILDIPVGTVKSRMASAELKLRERLVARVGVDA